jgi:O-antigen ligase
MAAFWLWGLMSLWWSQDPSLGLDLLRRYALALLLLVLVITRTTSRAAVDGLMGALAIAAWVLVACGLFAMLTGSRTIDDRLAVFDMNPNDLGNVLLLVTAGVLWRALSPGSTTPARTKQAVAFLGIAMLLIAQSGSRGSLLAFVLLLLGFTATRTLRRWGMVATALGIVVLVAAPAVFGTVLDRARHEDPRQLSRVTLWQSGLALIADHPFGVGLGVGPYVMPTYIDMRSTDVHPPHMPAHNPPIEVGTDTGLVGMALYNGALVLAAVTFVGSVRRWNRWRDPLWLAYGATIGTCSVAFLATWWKSGGESYSYTTFLLLALWLVGARASRPQSGSAAPAVTVGHQAGS